MVVPFQAERESLMPGFIYIIALAITGMMVPNVAPYATAEALSARTIMDKNFYAAKHPHLISESTMILINERGQERIRKLSTIMALQGNGIDSHVLTRFTLPADIQGTG